jgi:hypothetical protein
MGRAVMVFFVVFVFGGMKNSATGKDRKTDRKTDRKIEKKREKEREREREGKREREKEEDQKAPSIKSETTQKNLSCID